MTTPVRISVQMSGVAEAKADLKSVRQAYVDLEQASVAATSSAAKKRIALIREESKARIDSIRAQSNARKEALASEKDFKSSVSGRSGGGDPTKGGAVSDLLKNAGIAGAAFAAVSSAINMATGALKQFGSFVINDVIKPAWVLQTRSQQVANNSQGMLTSQGIQDRAKSIGLANNMDPMKVIEAAGAYQDLTGDSKQGFEMMDLFGAMSKGRGDADPKELAELAASFRKEGMSTKQLQDIMLAYAGQGEKGSITIGQLAKLGGRISAPAEKMGGDQFTKMTTAGALLQTARHGFGTVDDLAAGLKGFMDDSMKVAKVLSPKAVGRVNGVDTLLDPTKFIGDIYRKTGGNQLEQKGFSAPAAKFLESYQGTYKDAYSEAKKGGKTDKEASEAGAMAVEEFINSMRRSTSTMDAEGQKRDAVMATAGERFTQTFDKIKDKLAGSALPMAEKFVNYLEANGESLERAGTTLVGVLGVIADAFMVLVDGVLGWAEFFDQLVTNHTTGDVRKTVTQSQIDKLGDMPEVRTRGPLGGDKIRGSWIREQGEKGQKDQYKFVQIDEGTDISQYMADRGLVPAEGWSPDQKKSGQGVFVKKKASAEDVARANTSGYGTREPTSEYEPYTSSPYGEPEPEPQAQNMEPYLPPSPFAPTEENAGGDGAAESAQAVAASNEDLATKAKLAGDAIDGFTKKVQDASSSMDSLNRSKSFTDTK